MMAKVLDAQGNELTGRAVTWSSSSPESASINSASGLVSGISPVTATIIATSEGVSGTTTLFVTPRPLPAFAAPQNQFTPLAGPGGTEVTIFGSNFDNLIGVTFGGADATILSSSTDQIVVRVPTVGTGKVNIIVTTAGGTVFSDDLFDIF